MEHIVDDEAMAHWLESGRDDFKGPVLDSCRIYLAYKIRTFLKLNDVK